MPIAESSPHRVPSVRSSVLVALIGIAVSSLLSWTSWHVDRSNENRLLHLQTRQAATVISSAVVAISSPLVGAADVAAATGGDPARFDAFMTKYVGTKGVFVHASLWRTDTPTPVRLAQLGAGLDAAGAARSASLIRRATSSSTFVVTSVTTADRRAVAYAFGPTQRGPFAVFAERAIPANRRVAVESDSAFADLHFATYLGRTESASALQTTDVDPQQLPLTGGTARAVIPFGDTSLLLVAAPSRHLGGGLLLNLPWIVLAGGAIATVAASATAWQLERRRTSAEGSAATITALYEELGRLYGEQRSISVALQHALLPQTNPTVPGLEIASTYAAGAQGVDVGGDWFSIVRIDKHRIAFVVGDVSGRGAEAAALMGRLRFTLRAYLLEGHPPDLALSLTSKQLDIIQDGRLATVLAGTADLRSRTLVLANAGHLNPLVIAGADAHFVATTVGPPLGVGAYTYRTTTTTMPPESTFLAFTDGLVERRTEPLDEGLARLLGTARTLSGSLDGQCAELVARMTQSVSEDDVALLAFRWVPAPTAAADDVADATPAALHPA